MSSFKFDHIVHGKPDFASPKMYIWVWNADKTPPHLGFSIGKEYFSLTFKASERKSVSGMLGKATRLKIPLLWIEFEPHFELNQVVAHFGKYSHAISGESTCLSPIKELFGFGETIQQLAHLLTALHTNEVAFKVFALHLDASYKALPFYTIDAINERIHALTYAGK